MRRDGPGGETQAGGEGGEMEGEAVDFWSNSGGVLAESHPASFRHHLRSMDPKFLRNQRYAKKNNKVVKAE